MKNILQLNTVSECNKCMGAETIHPLVSVIDLSEEAVSNYNYIKCNFYAVLLLEHSCCDYYYGRRAGDYSDGSVIFLTPKKCMELDLTECDSCLNKGKMLIFHKDMISETSLRKHFKADYSFFQYNDNEALHISEREKLVFLDSIQNIKREVEHYIDRFSAVLIARLIEVLLDYCRRFYERQYILRHDVDAVKIGKLKSLLNEYYADGMAKTQSVPSAKWCAEQLHHSAAYLSNMLEYEMGMNTADFVQYHRINMAIELIMHTDESISHISEKLGFSNSIYFNRIFKKVAGCLPEEYRSKN